jgi:hypothetical protein
MIPIHNKERVDISGVHSSLQTILHDVLNEHLSDSLKLLNSSSTEEVLMKVKSKIANVLLERLKSRLLDKMENSSEIERQFEEAVLMTWRKPFDLLDLLLSVCLEVSNDFRSERGTVASKRSYVQMALVRQQANACLVFNEILHLLKSGFSRGAQSRWRTLHEIVCVSYFVSKHGEKVAKRFLDYEVVEACFQAEATFQHKRKIDCASRSKRDFKALEKDFKARQKTYGDDFVKQSNYPYGWIPHEVIKTRSFREIEKSVKLSKFRPYYELASYDLHGGQNGLILKLGIMKKNGLKSGSVGPSNYGLADPGKSAAISLGQVTACLLTFYSDIKRAVLVEALRNLVDEICDSFDEVEAEFV